MAHDQLLESLQRYVQTVSTAFKDQAIRLRDPSVLVASRDLLILYFKTLKQLGSREHDLGIYTLEQQIERSQQFAAASRRRIKESLGEVLKRQPNAQESADTGEVIASINDLLDQTDPEPEIRTLLLDIRTNIGAMDTSERQMAVTDNAMRSSLLDFDVKMHLRTYSRLALQRFVGFCGRHLFIISVSVATMGIGYSWFVTAGEHVVRNYVSSNGFLIAAFIFSAAVLKEYFFSKQVKKLRVRFERWLLFPVAHHVFQANIHGLYSEIAGRAAPNRAA